MHAIGDCFVLWIGGEAMNNLLILLAVGLPVGGWAEPINSHMVTLGNTQATFISSTETLFIDGYDCKVNLEKHTAVCRPTAKPTGRKLMEQAMGEKK